MMKIRKRLPAILLAVVIAVAIMPMLGMQTAYAGTHSIHLKSALHNSNWGVYTIREQSTVWLDPDEVCNESDDFMMAYLENTNISVYYHDPINGQLPAT